MNKPIKIISVSEAAIYFGIWSNRLDELKNKKVVVVNRKNRRPVAAFEIIDMPVPIKQKCACCGGTGETELKIDD